MSSYTIVTNYLAKDSLISGNPLKLIKGADFTTEFTAVQTALNSKFDGAVQFAPDGTSTQPSFGFTNNAGTGMYNAAGVLGFSTGATSRLTISAAGAAAFTSTLSTAGLLSANLGLTVSGAAFTSRGITDSATATALTIAAGGSVTIAPTSGTAFNVLGVGSASTVALSSASATDVMQAVLQLGGTPKGYFGIIGTAGQLITGSAQGDYVFRSENFNILLSGNAGAGIALKIDSSNNVNVSNGTTLSPVYAGAPINQQVASYTTVLSDANKTIYHNNAGAHTITVPANATVAYPTGTMLTFVNTNGGGALTLSFGDTLEWSPSGSTGNRTLAAVGMATAIKTDTSKWFISGTGLT